MSKIHIYLFTLLLSLYSIFYIIPIVTYELDDFHQIEKTYRNSQIVDKKYTIRQNTVKLILTMSDSTLWYIRGEHSDYFNILSADSNIGKRFTFYTKSQFDDEPVRVDIEDEIIFDIDVGNTGNYAVLTITTLFILISIWQLLLSSPSTKYRTTLTTD